MPLTLEQTTTEALSLPEPERAWLAHILIASLESIDAKHAAEWDAEIAGRVGEINRGTARGRPVADVVREVRSRHK